MFQDRFVSELEQLHNVQVNIGDVNISVQRVLLHCHLADLVAKAPSLCFFQFNGKSGCSICLDPGNMEKGAFVFTLTVLNDHLNGHMPKHCCMLMLPKELDKQYLVSTVFLPFCVVRMFHLKFHWTTCILCLLENS